MTTIKVCLLFFLASFAFAQDDDNMEVGDGAEQMQDMLNHEQIRQKIISRFKSVSPFDEKSFESYDKKKFVLWVYSLEPGHEMFAEKVEDVAQLIKDFKFFYIENTDPVAEFMGVSGWTGAVLMRDGSSGESIKVQANEIQGLAKHLKRLTVDGVCPTLSESDLARALDYNRAVVIGRCSTSDVATLRATLSKLSTVPCVHVVSDELSVEVNQKYTDPSFYTGPWKSLSLFKFIKEAAAPLVVEVNENSFQELVRKGKPLFLVFADPIQYDEVHEAMAKGGAQFARDISLAYAHGPGNENAVANFGLSGEQFPSGVIIDLNKNLKYVFPEDDKLLGDGKIAKFLQDFTSGALSPSVKKKKAPERQTNAIEAVWDTWEQLVTRSGRDALVEFYAPWCGHCQQLAPIYEQLGDLFKNVSINIVKYDADGNDAPAGVIIEGFPTLKFYPADGGDPIPYEEQQRDLISLFKFIKKHATIPIPDSLESVAQNMPDPEPVGFGDYDYDPEDKDEL